MSTIDVDERAMQKGSAEMVVLALLETRPRHGYELAKLIGSESESRLQFHVASLYPMLYRLERKGLVEGRWLEKAGERRRRFYKLTPAGRKMLAQQRRSWREFVAALDRLTGFAKARSSHA
jgi:transcriptional regulator